MCQSVYERAVAFKSRHSGLVEVAHVPHLPALVSPRADPWNGNLKHQSKMQTQSIPIRIQWCYWSSVLAVRRDGGLAFGGPRRWSGCAIVLFGEIYVVHVSDSMMGKGCYRMVRIRERDLQCDARTSSDVKTCVPFRRKCLSSLACTIGNLCT